MADNIDVDPGTTGSKQPVATDDCGASGHFQRVKLDGGSDGVSTPFVAGQQAMAASFPVVLASDQSILSVSATNLDIRDLTSASDSIAAVQSGVWSITWTVPSSGGPTNVTASATSVTLLGANAARKGASIMNDSTEILYVKFGATASAASFHVKMAAGSYLEIPFGYTGIIDGIWASATGDARVGEFT